MQDSSNTTPREPKALQQFMDKLFDPSIVKGLSDDEMIDLLTKKLTSLYVKNNIKTKKMAPDVIKQLVNIAFSDILDYVTIDDDEPIEMIGIDENGNKETIPTDKKITSQTIRLKNLAKLTDEQRASIESIEQTRYGIKFKLHNKIPALDLLVKHFGLVVQRYEHTGADGGPIEVNGNRRVYVVPAINRFNEVEEANVVNPIIDNDKSK